MKAEDIKIAREEAFCDDWYMVRKMGKTPTYADAIEWADKTKVKEICDRLRELIRVYDLELDAEPRIYERDIQLCAKLSLVEKLIYELENL